MSYRNSTELSDVSNPHKSQEPPYHIEDSPYSIKKIVSQTRDQLIPYPFRVAVFFTVILWMVFLLGKLSLPVVGDFLRLGIVPRSSIGFIGIFTAPWIHADLKHLLSNQPLFLHLVFLSILKPKREGIVILLLVASTGLGVWLFGMGGNHIGASGLIFALQMFNIFSSFYQKRWLLLGILSLFLVLENTFFYGIFGWISFDGYHISYSSHISGLVCGILWAIFFGKKSTSKTLP